MSEKSDVGFAVAIIGSVVGFVLAVGAAVVLFVTSPQTLVRTTVTSQGTVLSTALRTNHHPGALFFALLFIILLAVVSFAFTLITAG